MRVTCLPVMPKYTVSVTFLPQDSAMACCWAAKEPPLVMLCASPVLGLNVTSTFSKPVLASWVMLRAKVPPPLVGCA